MFISCPILVLQLKINSLILLHTMAKVTNILQVGNSCIIIVRLCSKHDYRVQCLLK